MSSRSHHHMIGQSVGEVDLTDRFSEQMAQLCMNENYSDVVFVIENQRLPAHRVILASRSEYFRALLYGGMSESRQHEINLKAPLEAFKALLRYIYSGHMPLKHLGEDNVLDVLGLANQHGLTDLEFAISDYLRQFLTLNNVCSVLDASRLYCLDKLSNVCMLFLDRNAADIITHDSFMQLTKESLEEILQRDSFFVAEVQIFKAVSRWCKHNPGVESQSLISHVRLPLMNLEHLLQVVRPSGLIVPERLLDAIEEQTTSRDLPYRATLLPEANVATSRRGARTLLGESRNSLLNGNNTTADMERGYTHHTISDKNNNGIVVELGTISIINSIKFLLWDHDNRAYSYFIEVSVNQSKWDRIIDYSNYYCRSWQYLYFKSRPVRYIRVVGTHNTVNKEFHLASFEAAHISAIRETINDVVTPIENVARVDMSAVVEVGVCRTKNALINEDFVNYDWDSGYTCHQLGSGEIIVRLGQPYMIGSMRLLLWDCDDRSYSYYIETSVDQNEWEMVVDKRNENAKSWQNVFFTPRPIVYIRIVGTRNTANEIFHCVHFECPSQDPNPTPQIKKDTANDTKSENNKSNDDPVESVVDNVDLPNVAEPEVSARPEVDQPEAGI